MDGDKLLMAAGVTCAIATAAFVFLGTPGSSNRLRQRRGQIAGLHNFGKTCFLNSLLQALAACPQMLSWLQLHGHSEKNSLIHALQNVLEVVNGTHSVIRSDPYNPGLLIRALCNLGWRIPQDEHDPHELLHVLLQSLEEETTKPKQPLGGLIDVLNTEKDPGMPTPRPSSAMLTDFCNQEYAESTNTNFMRMVRSEVHTPDSPSSSCTENEDPDNSLLDEYLASPPSLASTLPNRSVKRIRNKMGNGSLHKKSSGSCRSLDRLNRGPGRISIWSDMLNMPVAHPFRGGLSSQMLCNDCGHKSVVRYDKFDSVTLNLPEARLAGLSLGNLMSDFVKPEVLQNVTCEACHKTTNHTKSLTFGKLPSCLCIHISRTTWSPDGRPHKRQDYVHFPESLSMAPYSFVQPGLSQASTPWGSTLSLYSSSLPTESPFQSMGAGMYNPFNMPRNLYRLLAVVVHSGEANTGHFVTFRRGALRNSHKWYYTSDTIVKEVEIETVLESAAYLLFYDRKMSK